MSYGILTATEAALVPTTAELKLNSTTTVSPMPYTSDTAVCWSSLVIGNSLRVDGLADDDTLENSLWKV